LEIGRREPLREQIGDAGDADPAVDASQDVSLGVRHARSLARGRAPGLAFR
jgi:hypothetical protein